MKKRKTKFNSLSTPGVKQDCSNYLVELAFLRANHGNRLAPKFWQQSRYKYKYRNEIQACRKFIKKYGEAFVLYIAMHNHITTWTSYGNVEFLLQQQADRLDRLAKTKDHSEVKQESIEILEDIRENRIPTPKKKGLFERIEDIYGQEEKRTN